MQMRDFLRLDHTLTKTHRVMMDFESLRVAKTYPSGEFGWKMDRLVLSERCFCLLYQLEMSGDQWFLMQNSRCWLSITFKP